MLETTHAANAAFKLVDMKEVDAVGSALNGGSRKVWPGEYCIVRTDVKIKNRRSNEWYVFESRCGLYKQVD